MIPDNLGDLKSEEVWPEARIPLVSEELATKAKLDSDGADWAFDNSMEEVDLPLTKRKNELMEGKNYMGM